MNTRDSEYMALAAQLSMARVQFSREFQIARAKVGSDQHATQIAVERTNDQITVIQAKMRIAEGKL